MAAPIFFSPDDDAMRAAAAEAQRTFRFFWREMTWEYRRIVPGLDLAAVKVAFWDGGAAPARPDEVEHMWVGDVGFDGARVTGTLLNAPNQLMTLREGDPVDVPFERVGDWMYAIGGQVYGGFTVNLIRSRMSAAERHSHDAAWGLDFGDPASIALIPAPKPTRGFLGLFGAREAPPIDLEAEHPMSENMTAKYAEQLARDVSPAQVRDEAGWTQLHYFALGGSAGVVDVLLKAGADPAATTPDGRTARHLAEAMGWPRVVELLKAAGG